MTKVEIFEAIRRDKYVQGKSVREIARERGLHRRTVRQALNDALPPARKAVLRSAPVLTAAMQALANDWLQQDKGVRQKQRHTARRIFQRLQAEVGYGGAESTVRRYVSQRRRELGVGVEVFVPLCHDAGQEAEVDWYEADVRFPWGLETVQFFEMRACFSGREFHIAFAHQTQQAFLEAHAAAFSHFQGVFAVLRYDNLKAAVIKVLQGRRRQETALFVGFRSHYLFASEFCRPGKVGAHEKGGVEGGVGRFRRRHLVPVPEVESYDALNRLLLDACAADDLRTVAGHSQSILQAWVHEVPRLRALPAEQFETMQSETVRVTSKSCAVVRQNFYSVPVGFAGLQVEAHVHAMRVDFYAAGKQVARHPRLWGKFGWHLDLDHYLELLHVKPGALGRSLPLRQARERGTWPAVYDTLWSGLRARHGDSNGTREVLDVLLLHREYSAADVEMAVRLALEYGCHDAAAIDVLVRQLTHGEPTAAPLTELGGLARYNRPVRPVCDYNQLLGHVLTSKEMH
jgi:transposase